MGKAVTGKEELPQKIKYHLDQLLRAGFLRIEGNAMVLATREKVKSGIVPIPILGTASCGPATQLAEENVVGYLSLSEKYLPRNHINLFIVQAVGQSMNKAHVNGAKEIKDGDYVLVDGKNRQPKTGAYVLAVANGAANIKKFVQGADGQIALISESTEDIPPIFIHPDDDPEFFINGAVLDVFKNPR